jgi:protease II
MSHFPLHFFQINTEDNYCVLIFDTEMNGKSFDIIVKDLSTSKLMPVLILNAQDEVAFDKHQGFYYCQIDAEGQGKRVFRHQLGSLQNQDVLIYEETNPEFRVNLSNSLSTDFVMVEIASTFQPRTNEIWMRNAANKNEKFWLVQPMQLGVHYDIKHSGSFLYKMSNEKDGINYEVTRIALPQQLNSKFALTAGQQKLEAFSDDSARVTATITQVNLAQPQDSTDEPVQYRLQKREIKPVSNFLTQRDQALMQAESEGPLEGQLALTDENKELVSVPTNTQVLIPAEEHVRIKSFEVFKNYLAVLQERNGILELKTINLLNP